MPQPPSNAYKPGTKLTVGSHQVSIIKYISEGGFAHVYTCNIDPPFQGSNVACLKRVAVPSKWQLSLLRQEVDAMRRLRGNTHIVSYIDSHASRMNVENSGPRNQQQYEVFLLMEYCEKNGLIDFMNTRLSNKLTETEIIDIMYQVTIGVAMCHHLRPPLIHRDIKIENVLIDSAGVFKLCDFGSSVNYMAPPRNPQELQLMKDDIMQHTTPQYRAPEMIDLTKGFPIDDKLDVWALGVFLYKLCYYTTPFERPNQSSLEQLEHTILNCSENLRFNDQPGLMFSSRLKNVIKVCLRADPRRRPNTVQLLGEIAAMKGETGIPNVIPYSVKESMKTKQQVPPVNLDEIKREHTFPEVKRTAAIKSDPFASIDKTKILAKKSSPFTLEPIASPNRPLSAYFEDSNAKRIYSQGNRSTPSVQDYVKKELAKSRESYELNDVDDGTLEFLKSREENYIPTRHDTGGSFKAALKNGLRKISTGGSISANNTGSSIKSNRRKSLKQILTGSRKASNEEISKHERKPSSSAKTIAVTAATTAPAPTSSSTTTTTSSSSSAPSSIQNRMQQLMKQNDSQRIHKSAQGYGRFTDTKVSDDLDSINKSLYEKTSHHHHHRHHSHGNKKLSPPAVPVGLSSRRSESPSTGNTKSSQSKTLAKVRAPPVVPTKSKPPPKPRKPKYLKSPEKNGDNRRLSTSSEISMPDLDDLEKQFSKRFPSYV